WDSARAESRERLRADSSVVETMFAPYCDWMLRKPFAMSTNIPYAPLREFCCAAACEAIAATAREIRNGRSMDPSCKYRRCREHAESLMKRRCMWQGCYAPWPLLLSSMEVIIDPLRQRFVDPFDGRKIGGGGAAHALCRPETVEQGLLAPHANARNLIQRILSEVRSSPPGAMRADGPAVRLVAKSLEIIERRIVR